MLFASSIAEDLLYEQFKARPEFAKLEKDVSGTPLYLIVTHTVRPTSGGAAAGLLTAFLSGSTLGLVPIVTNDEYVLRYEVWMHGKAIASWSYSRSKTRAQNLWTMNGDPTQALGKEGMEWLKTTTAEVADKVLHDPAVARVQAEIDYYFPAVVTTAAAAVPATAPAGPPDAAGKAAPAGTK